MIYIDVETIVQQTSQISSACQQTRKDIFFYHCYKFLKSITAQVEILFT